MDTVLRFKGTPTMGELVIDFAQKKIIYEKKDHAEFSFSEITGVELTKPNFLMKARFSMVINGKKLFSGNASFTSNADITEIRLNKNGDYPVLCDAIERIRKDYPNIEIRDQNGFQVPTAAYTPGGNTQGGNAAGSGSSNGPIYTLKNATGDILTVYENYLTLGHKGVLNALAMGGLKGEKRIPFTSISVIEFRQATAFTLGYIQFTMAGGIERQGGVVAAGGDENSIQIGASANPLAQTIVDYIEERRMALMQPQATQVVQQTSAADELKKFKDMLDAGVITQAEFDQKKAQLLGL